jgi:hypothetical protein
MSRREFGTARAVLGAATLSVALAVLVAAAGCNSSDPSAAEMSSGAKKAAKVARNGRPDMVAAVSTGRVASPVDVRFAITQRPTVGQPLDIEVALTPSQDLELVFARFQVVDGLELVKGTETERREHPHPGEPISHVVTVLPKADGIFYLTATVLTDTDTASFTRTFYIPIISGNGLPALSTDAGPPTAANPADTASTLPRR